VATVLIAVLAGGVLTATSCGERGERGDTAAIEPLRTPPAPDPTLDTRASTTSTPPADLAATPDAEPSTRTDEATTVVAAVLERYGRLLGALAADPAGAPPPGSPARTEWDALVLPGSPLSIELLDRLTRRALEERVVIEPGPDGVSYRHMPVTADPVRDDPMGATIEFRWCGWSPGIGRSIDTGEVVDDAVAHAVGTGRLVRVDGAWLLAALDQDDLVLLAPGSSDPCPNAPGSGTP
jgi:hypothetical protein